MKLLLLAGTQEARMLAGALRDRAGCEVTASFAGRTRTPAPLGVATRVGGFGGAEGFAQTLRRDRFDAVIDATHPFAAHMARTAAAVCRDLGVAHLRLLRPPWQRQEGDDWIPAADEADAAARVSPGSRVFLATGPARLGAFAPLDHSYVVCRRVDPAPVPFPLAQGHFHIARPPFSPDAEERLFRDLDIGWLVARNSGGAPGRAKLVAARRLAIKVVMIARPPAPECVTVGTPQAALKWLEERQWTP